MCDETTNPHCINPKPTDPLSWFLNGSTWSQALDFIPAKTYHLHDLVKYQYKIYACTSTNCSPMSAPSGTWTQIKDLDSSGVCSTGPIPDPISGKCEKSDDNGLLAHCTNPCVRLDNGTLVVNKNSNQCRVFGTTSDGASGHCPTVCPQACVELWETCPPGSGILTTLATKSSKDVLALTGPVKIDLSTNGLWPTSYSGKSYTECYSYNTKFCDMPMATQVTTLTAQGPISLCYANCPQGTFPSPLNSKICLFNRTDGLTSKYDQSTPVQRVFCNPQYFNPSYWGDIDVYNPTGTDPTLADYSGIQKGCSVIAVPSKTGTTCAAGTIPYVNEYFTLEWCLPACKPGYVVDVTQGACVATCEDTQNGFNPFLDYVDFYAISGRCEMKNGVEVNCAHNNTSGRCPVTQRVPSRSFDLPSYGSASSVLWDVKSLNHQCPASQTYGYGGTFHDIESYQSSRKSNTSSTSPYAECPDGMIVGNVGCLESPQLCYDICSSGYEPVAVCANGAKTCTNPIYTCRAQCPQNSEGLGTWSSVDYDEVSTCAYHYPNGIPTDPNLIVQCPDDGRYITQSSTSGDNTTISRAGSICVKRNYLRNATCPKGYILQAGGDCIQACNSSEIIVTLPDGSVVCQSSSSDTTRHEVDFVSVADRALAKGPFKNRVLTRKSYNRGLGNDPSSVSAPSTGLGPKVGLGIGAIIMIIIVLSFIFKKKR